MGPRLLQQEMHSCFDFTVSTWTGYLGQVSGYFSVYSSGVDFPQHVMREYNKKIADLGIGTGYMIRPYDGGFRFIGTGIGTGIV